VEAPFDLLSLFVYASLVGLVHTVQLHRESKERERRAEALEAQLTAARLSALQAQLHPHFLFNALNAISTLLVRDVRAARDALASFSELLRLALSQSTQAEVTLHEDLEFLRRYVQLQQTRLGDRLRFEEVIPSETLDCLVPALLLQPLVENAIRHGIEPSLHPGLVRVVIQPQASRLKVTVEDNGTGLSSGQRGDSEGTGIGLKNLKARLETLYGLEQGLEFNCRHQGGAVVTVAIPLRRAPTCQPAAIEP
jgi:sensor histidine kinase YesM